jgi:hypothetical protein
VANDAPARQRGSAREPTTLHQDRLDKRAKGRDDA